MQTFVTFQDWAKCADALDDKRLNGQRSEGLLILKTVLGEHDAYENHPVMDMWRGYHSALAVYVLQHCTEWSMKRGHIDNIQFTQVHPLFVNSGGPYEFDFVSPPWREDPDVMRSHRSNLIRKDPAHYGKMFKGTPLNMPYLWPVCYDDGSYDLIVSKADQKRIKDGERVLPKSIEKRLA